MILDGEHCISVNNTLNFWQKYFCFNTLNRLIEIISVNCITLIHVMLWLDIWTHGWKSKKWEEGRQCLQGRLYMQIITSTNRMCCVENKFLVINAILVCAKLCFIETLLHVLLFLSSSSFSNFEVLWITQMLEVKRCRLPFEDMDTLPQ